MINTATTIESMTGISIHSPFFKSSPLFEMFPKHQDSATSSRIALLYGKNGSGKSTIAQGFREYRDSINPRSVTLTPLAKSAAIVITPPALKPEKFFIFDEEYIATRIKISDKNGLDAIVLFGEQVSLEQQIESIAKDIAKLKSIEKHQIDDCTKYKNSSTVDSPSYWIAKIEASLGKGKNDGWASKGSEIKGNKKNQNIDMTAIDRIGKLVPTKTEDSLKEEFARLYTLFSSTNMQSSTLPKQINIISISPNIETSSRNFLSQVIVKPKLTNREQEIMSVFGLDLAALSLSQDFLADKTKAFCNRCLQPISINYRNDTLAQIKNILNREVEEFQKKLKELLITQLNLTDYQCYSVLSPASYNAMQNQLTSLNNAIEAHNQQIQQKIANPYDEMMYNKHDLIAACTAANQALMNLETERIKYNQTVQQRTTTMQLLLDLNDAIAHFAIASDYKALQTQKKSEVTALEALKATRDKIAALEHKVVLLDSQRKNFQIAADEINRSLEYIFFSKERISLELGSDQLYHLKSYGYPVDPNKVSCGERNALALCYFFTEISRDMDAKSVYADEVFLVIDDPISSFDLENRIGMMTFLRWKIKQVLDGCSDTKLLIMTHDISVMFDMQKVLNEIFGYRNNLPKNSLYYAFHLENKQITAFNYRSYEYTQLLERIFNYAKQSVPDKDTDLVIGNIMRRVLEAFSTFSFKKGISDISTDEDILSILDSSKRAYFQNLMYRLVLHGESHFEEYLKGAPETGFFTHLSQADKSRTTQDILCFLFLLNKQHILAHLPDAEQDITDWCKNLPAI